MSSLSLPFPTTPDAVTPNWLRDVLGQPVRAVRVEAFGEGAGIIGQVTRLHLDWDGPYPTLIAKFASPAPENRAVAASYDMYGREVRFYQHLVPRLDLSGVRLPRCYYAAIDPTDGWFTLLLEDLGHYRTGDQVAGCSAEEARRTVRTVAAMHAAGWQPDAGLGLVSHNNPAQRDGMIAGFQAGWPVVQERFAHLLPDGLNALSERMAAATPKLLDAMCQPPVCLTHADVRLDNVMFGSNDVCLIDWQSVCSSAPEQDLAYFITQSVPADSIDPAELTALYLAELQARGVDYPRSTFEERYRVSALYLLNYAVVIAGTLDMGNERGTQLAETLLGGAFRSLNALDGFSLLGEK